MKIATLGWSEFIDPNKFKSDVGLGPTPVNYAVTKGTVPLENLVVHIRDTQPDFVILDGDAFREIADCVEAMGRRK